MNDSLVSKIKATSLRLLFGPESPQFCLDDILLYCTVVVYQSERRCAVL